jgi:VanZ family protein
MSCAPEHAHSSWICSHQASVVFLVIVLLVVLGLSLTPHPESVLGKLSLYDKAGHFAAYIVLSFFAVRSIGCRGALPFVLAITACTALGGLIEVIQPFVERRMELGDFLVDPAGSVTGATLSFLMIRRGDVGESS